MIDTNEMTSIVGVVDIDVKEVRIVPYARYEAALVKLGEERIPYDNVVAEVVAKYA